MDMIGIVVMLLLGGDMITGLLEAPPQDLASLVEPVPALQRMDEEVTEDALIQILRREPAGGPDTARLERAVENLGHRDYDVRQKAQQTLRKAGLAAEPLLEQAAKSDDPEVRLTAKKLLQRFAKERRAAATDMAYARKLLAVRALQQMGSREALPALKELAESQDVTLAAAASDAVAVIEGAKPSRPSGMAAMRSIATRLPNDTAVCVLGEFASGSRTLTLTDTARMLSENAGQHQGALQAMGITVKEAKETLARTRHMAAPRLVQLLATTGNMRVDAVAIVMSSGVTNDRGWLAFVFTGLYDPKRLGRVLKNTVRGGPEYREVLGVPVYGPESSAQYALVDKNTFAILWGAPGPGETSEPIIRALLGEPKDSLPPAVEDALAQFEHDDARIAVGARPFLGAPLEQELRRELGEEIEHNKRDDVEGRLERAGLRVFLAMLDLESVRGYLSNSGTVTLSATARDPDAATDMAGSLREVEAAWAGLLRELGQHTPAGMEGHFAVPEGVEIGNDEREVTLKVPNGLKLLLGPFFGLGAAPVEPQPLPPARAG